MAKVITALELRNRFGAVMDDVRYRKEPYIVKRNGRPAIVLVDIDAYQAAEARRHDEAFIEDYTDERIAEFLKADRVDRPTRARLKTLLG